MHEQRREGPRPEPGGRPAGEPAAAPGFAALAARLRAIAERADSHRWPGWTDDDARTIEAAAREIEQVESALAAGMREAFDIGREYGHGEELLDRLQQEIGEASNRLARQAWGGREPRGRGTADGAGGPAEQ